MGRKGGFSGSPDFPTFSAPSTTMLASTLGWLPSDILQVWGGPLLS